MYMDDRGKHAALEQTKALLGAPGEDMAVEGAADAVGAADLVALAHRVLHGAQPCPSRGAVVMVRCSGGAVHLGRRGDVVEVVEELRQAPQATAAVPLHTFSCGQEDGESPEAREFARAGCGLHFHIDRCDAITQCLGHCFPGLVLELYASAQLTLVAENGAEMTGFSSTQQSHTVLQRDADGALVRRACAVIQGRA